MCSEMYKEVSSLILFIPAIFPPPTVHSSQAQKIILIMRGCSLSHKCKDMHVYMYVHMHEHASHRVQRLVSPTCRILDTVTHKWTNAWT